MGFTKYIRTIPLATLICAGLLLSGCGWQSAEKTESTKRPVDAEGVTIGAAAGDFYSAAPINIQGRPDNIAAVYSPDGYVYLCCLKTDTSSVPYTKAEQWISRLDLNDFSVTELWRDPGSGYGASISMASDSEGNIWMLKSRANYGAPGRENIVLTLMRFSPDSGGMDSWSLDFIDEESDKAMYPGKMAFAGDGALFISFSADGETKLVGLDVSSGEITRENVVLTLDTGAYGDGFIGFIDGDEALCYGRDPDGSFIRSVNICTEQKGEKQRVDTRIGAAYMGAGEFNALVDDGSNLYSLDPVTGTLTKILNWVSCGIAESPRFISLPDGSFLAMSYIYGDFGTAMICDLLSRSETGVPSATLTIATAIPYSGVPEAAVRFNREHEDVKIEVLDYSVYGSVGDYSAGMMKMAVEVISGKVPDIFYLSELPAARYASQGLFADLYPLIDADPELNRSDFHENILEAFEIGDGLYELPLSFYISTIAGRSDVVGEKPGWSLDEFMALVEKTGAEKPFGEVERDWFLETMLFHYGDVFVDWGAGECDFDNDFFRGLLKICKTMSDEPDTASGNYVYVDLHTALRDGMQLVTYSGMHSYFEALMLRAQFGGADITFKGFPGAPGGGSAVAAKKSFAISSVSENKEAAWEFLSWLLEYDDLLVASEFGFPVTKAGLDALLDYETAKDYERIANGETSYPFVADVPYEPESDEALIRELIESQTRAARSDDKLLAIISEEAGAFFAGDKSVEETARIIQSRASIYVAEQS